MVHGKKDQRKKTQRSPGPATVEGDQGCLEGGCGSGPEVRMSRREEERAGVPGGRKMGGIGPLAIWGGRTHSQNAFQKGFF